MFHGKSPRFVFQFPFLIFNGVRLLVSSFETSDGHSPLTAGGVMAHQQQGEMAGLNNALRKDSTEGFNCTSSDSLFQSDTVLGKNEKLEESMRQDIFMKECSDADLVGLVERLEWSIGRATKP